MAKFSIEGISSGTGSGVLSIKPNLNNDPNSIHRGVLKIYQVTEGEGGTKVKTLKKTINLTQNKKGSSGGGSGGGDTPTSSKIYRIEIYNNKNFYIIASAPNGTSKTYSVLLVGNTDSDLIRCRCYSVEMDPNTGILDESTKTKINMTLESSDPNLTFDTSKMEDSSVALADSYFTIKSDTNETRTATVTVYPSDMIGKKDEYSITISVNIQASS